MKRRGKFNEAPATALQRLERAALRNAEVAELTLALFDAILGRGWSASQPRRPWALNRLQEFPASLRHSAVELATWGAQSNLVLNQLLRVETNVAAELVSMRRASPYGRRRRRIADSLRRKCPAGPSLNSSKLQNLQLVHVLGEELGQPLGEATMRRVRAFQPSRVEIQNFDEPFFATSAHKAVNIRLQPDGFSIRTITMCVAVEKSEPKPIVFGVLEDFFETGTEGLVWSVLDEDDRGYDALYDIREGDHLTILDPVGHRVWAGKIRCDREAGWKRYPMNPEFGQPCALGYWIHWTQRGFKPAEWARFFVRGGAPRFRAILQRAAA